MIVPDPLDAAPNERFELTRLPTSSDSVAGAKRSGKIEPGWAKGQVWIADNFDDPLEEFEEYS